MDKTLVKTFNSASHGGDANFKMGVITKTLKNGRNKATPVTLHRNHCCAVDSIMKNGGIQASVNTYTQLIGKLPWMLET